MSVKIVEALGWAYVVLAALAGPRMAYEVIHFGCAASVVAESDVTVWTLSLQRCGRR